DSSVGNDDETNPGNGNQAAEEEGKRTFVMENEGAVTTLTYYYEGDIVFKQTSENVIPYENIGLNSKEEAKEMLEPQSEQFQGIDGLKEKIEYHDSKAIETLEINYNEVNIEEVGELPGTMLDENAVNGISMEKSANMLLQQGFEEK